MNPSAVENYQNFFHVLGDFVLYSIEKERGNSIEIRKQWEILIKLLINVLN
jgi:hypothetical protein